MSADIPVHGELACAHTGANQLDPMQIPLHVDLTVCVAINIKEFTEFHGLITVQYRTRRYGFSLQTSKSRRTDNLCLERNLGLGVQGEG